MTMSILFQVALVASFALAIVSVASGARGAAPAARLAAGPADEGPPRRGKRLRRGGLERGLATLGLALTPTWQRTRLVTRLGELGRGGPASWHAFLATRGALALGAIAVATAAGLLWRPAALAFLAAGAWAIWRWQEARLGPQPALAAAESAPVARRAVVPMAAPAPEPEAEPGEGPLTQRLRRESSPPA